MINRFDGKVAIVTGGSSGIGAAIIARLISEGAQVLNADINAPATVADAVTFHRTDVRDAAQVQAMVAAAVARFGRLDVLINNAGIGLLAETPDMAEEDWDRLFAVNVTSVFHACKAAIPQMRGSGGAIVNVASISGLLGDYGMGAYNASKAAVINYTRSLALDCSRLGIRVNALCPGAIAGTAMAVGEHGGDEYRQSWLDTIPMRRFGTAAEMAGVAAFLASDDASYVTGAILAADGGATARTGQLDFPGRRRKREAGLA
jgi:meso-butanediol dehydrogenase/(S,S)-butanediol dehydrogenase/diacetyl reductase